MQISYDPWTAGLRLEEQANGSLARQSTPAALAFRELTRGDLS